MKAYVMDQCGGSENLIMKEIDAPIAGSNEVLINVKAISINPVDYKVRMIEDVLHMISGEGYPAILGWDIAGDVVAVGSDVNKFAVGDKVFGMVNFPGRGKAYAQQMTAPQDHLTKIPEGVSYEAAAATTLAALTALQVFKGNIKEGDKVLIQAGSGGVGHFAIQLAKHYGAHVITTCSSKNKDFVMSLGADEHIDYRETAFQDVLSDLDFVLDTMSGEIMENGIKVLRSGGSIVTIPGPPPEELVESAKAQGVNLSFLLVQSDGADMETLADFLAKGIIKPYVSRVFKWDEMRDAHEQLESGRTVGKVVVLVD